MQITQMNVLHMEYLYCTSYIYSKHILKLNFAE